MEGLTHSGLIIRYYDNVGRYTVNFLLLIKRNLTFNPRIAIAACSLCIVNVAFQSYQPMK